MPIADLRPFPGNAQRGNVPAILESLCRNGQYRAVVVREHATGLTTLAGNHTVQAIAAHGPGDCGLTTTAEDGTERPCALCGNEPWEPVARCEIITCDEDTALRINLVDNRSSELGGQDDHALALLLAELGGDLTGTGYEEADLEALLAAADESIVGVLDEDEGDEEEEPPARAEKPDPAKPTAVIPTGPAPGEPAPPLPSGHATLFLTYPNADREEITRLVYAAREILPDADAADLILRALRTLVALFDSRHAHDGVITAEALLKTAGVIR